MKNGKSFGFIIKSIFSHLFSIVFFSCYFPNIFQIISLANSERSFIIAPKFNFNYVLALATIKWHEEEKKINTVKEVKRLSWLKVSKRKEKRKKNSLHWSGVRFPRRWIFKLKITVFQRFLTSRRVKSCSFIGYSVGVILACKNHRRLIGMCVCVCERRLLFWSCRFYSIFSSVLTIALKM